MLFVRGTESGGGDGFSRVRVAARQTRAEFGFGARARIGLASRLAVFALDVAARPGPDFAVRDEPGPRTRDRERRRRWLLSCASCRAANTRRVRVRGGCQTPRLRLALESVSQAVSPSSPSTSRLDPDPTSQSEVPSGVGPARAQVGQLGRVDPVEADELRGRPWAARSRKPSRRLRPRRRGSTRTRLRSPRRTRTRWNASN
jgi:hypothetical protein